jgi:hypothetical protein
VVEVTYTRIHGTSCQLLNYIMPLEKSNEKTEELTVITKTYDLNGTSCKRKFMVAKRLCGMATNVLGVSRLDPPPGGQSGREKRPRLADDQGIVGPTTRTEVSHGSVYHRARSLPTASSPEPDDIPA